MKKSVLFRSSASAIAAGIILAASAAHAEDDVTREIDGNEGTGYVISNQVPVSTVNSKVINSGNVTIDAAAATTSGSSVSVGNSATQTIFTNFTTTGGSGSGGGAGLGGVFFVDGGRTLTLTNVSMLNNTAQGGTGGIGDLGGSMNNLVSPGMAATGQNGANSDVGFANFDGGKGGPGYSGYNGANATLGVGGTGGSGGNGSNGTPITADTVLQSLYLAYDAVQLAKTIKEGSDYTAIAAEMTALAVAAAAGANVGGPTTAHLAAQFTLLAAQFTSMAAAEAADAVEEAIRMAADTAYNIAMTITAYQVGAAGVGGDGGSGGTGGDGSKFFSGGIGGAGGYGGFAVGTSGAVGGGGGSGGDAGFSGFGAGGASGGIGGAGGASGTYGGVSGYYLNGDNGGGGTAGFGGGDGSTRSGYYGDSDGYQYLGGGGGSGYGGAIFVADGGTLNITGNALFANNYVVGGSSNNDGEAGEGVGTDLFMMKGSTVNLRPGIGNTIRFEGSIADDSAASIGGASLRSGDGASIRIGGGGLVQFAGENSYTGTTYIGGATLEAEIGVGIHSDSRVTFNGTGTIGSNLSSLTAGVLLTSGEIVRRVGTTLPHQVSWEGSGGFAAGDDGLTLNFGKLVSAPQGQQLYWGQGGFVGNGKTLIFGSEYGTGAVTLVNNVDLKTLQGRIAVYDNADSDGDWAVLAGKFTNGTLEVNDTGYAGTLYFTNQNTLSGLTLHNGNVSTQLDDKTGRLMNATTGGFLNITGGTADLYSAEKVTTMTIAPAGTANFHADLDSGTITNAGNLTVAGNLNNVAGISNWGTFSVAGSAQTGSIWNHHGTLEFNSNATTGGIDNRGEMTIAGAANVRRILNLGSLTFKSDTTVNETISNGGSLTFKSNATVNETIDNHGELVVSGALSSNDIINAGSLIVENGPTNANMVYNRERGTLELFGGSVLGNVTNLGRMLLAGGSTVLALGNGAGGTLYLDGNLDSEGVVYNAEGGTIYMAGNITSQSTVTNDGSLVVVGKMVNDVEQAAVRKILTAGFQDPTGVVYLGGLNGNVANTLVVEQSGDSLYSGTIVGPGQFQKAGAGTLALTGANTFTGGLAVNGGTLDTTGGGTFADTLDVTVAKDARYIVGTNDEVRSITNAGTLTGNAALIVTTLANSGSATLSGGFTARGNVTNSGALASTAAFAVNGTLTNATGATVALQGGTNTIGSMVNSGTVNAATPLTVTGAYVQNAGTLNATGGLATGSLSGTGGAINFGANTYTINQTANGTYAGAINGNGGTVVKNGAATLTLQGAAGSFAPSTLAVQQGTVAVNGAGILDSALSVTINAGASLSLIAGNQTIRNLTGLGTLALGSNNLFLSQGGNFDGAVTGAGNIQVTSGTFNLNNTINTTSGNFTVLQNSAVNVASTGTLNAPTVNVTGTMNVQGTVNSTNTYVNSGGVLLGKGTVKGLVTVGGASAGFLRPGNSPGELTVANLTLDNLSVTEMEIEGNAGAGLPAASGGYDRITVTGALKLLAGSTLQIANSNTFELALGEKVKVLNFTPGAVSGQFGTVTSAFDRKVAFNLATGTVVGLGTNSVAGFETAIAHTANETALLRQIRVGTAGGVNQYYGGRLIEFAASALATGNAANVAAAFDKASPEAYAGLADHMKLSMLDNRLELGGYAVAERPTVFVTGSVNYGQARSQDVAGYARYQSKDRRANLGLAVDLPIGRLQASYGHTEGDIESSYMNGDAAGDQFSFGASIPVTKDGALRMTGRFGYGTYGFEGTRVTNAGTAAFGTVDGTSAVYGAGVEFLRNTGKFSIDLSTEVLRVLNKVDGFGETGVGALETLNVHSQREQFELLAGKLKLGYAFQPGVQGFVNLAVDHDLDELPHTVGANVSVESVNLSVTTPGFARTRFDAGLGLGVDISDAIRWTVEGSVGNASRYGAKTAITVRF